MSLYNFKNDILKNVKISWLDILDNEILNNTLKSINSENISPKYYNIFEAFKYFELHECKLIIIGQDPYPDINHAMGLSFSTLANKLPPSLLNIFKCLKRDKHFYKGTHNIQLNKGNLINWAKQGVLLLNMAFTTEIGKSNIHTKLWKNYSINLIKKISNNNKIGNTKGARGDKVSPIFILLGNKSQNLIKYIKEKNNIFIEKHPSPLCQNRIKNENLKFINSKIFTNINLRLLLTNSEPIIFDPSINDFKSKYNLYKFLLFNKLDNFHIIFTDGSNYSGIKNKTNIKSNKGRGGYSLYFYKNKKKYIGNLSIENYNSTNIRAEGMAILKSLEIFLDKYIIEQKLTSNNIYKGILIITDSKFWIDMIKNYIPNWINKKLDLKLKKNSDIIIRLVELLNIIYEKKIILSLCHVYAHNKTGLKNSNCKFDKLLYKYNDLVDNLAKYARVNLKPGNFKEIINKS
tara:strand:+ start:1266 stop:2648 length:1383 start_codon:yes stop_codon:yes gene_type:complete